MNVKISPSVICGCIDAPASKSMAHRLLICAGLCKGESIIKNISYSEDILATLDCLKVLGAEIKKDGNTVYIKGSDISCFNGGTFSCRESGSTLRFFMPIAMLSFNKSLFTGYGRLMERPMGIYESLAEEKNLLYQKNNEGIYVSGKLTGGEFYIRGDISSQFVTGLLFVLPLLSEDSRIILTGKAESLSYIDMTVDALSRFGVTVKREKGNEFFIKGSQSYKPCSLSVEGDYSNAAFIDAFSLIGNRVSAKGLAAESKQGDRIYKKYYGLLKNGTPSLDVSDCPDLAPALMTLASMLNGAELTGTRRLSMKESDRGEAMKEELSKFGAKIETYENRIVISKSQLHRPEKMLSGHNDHRVVMSLSVICSVYGGEIEGSESVKKSYPDFFDVMRESGLKVIYNDD